MSLKHKLIPLPQSISESGEWIRIASFGQALCGIIVETDDVRVREGIRIIEKKLMELAAVPVIPELCKPEADADGNPVYCITIKADPAECTGSCARTEGYCIKVDRSGTVLCGYDEAGALYAAVTFADMLEKRGDGVWVPEAVISDYPEFGSRGQFLECRYGSEFMGREDWYQVIDSMALSKFNQLTIGVYGCWSLQHDGRRTEYLYVPIKKYPQLRTLKNKKYYSVKEERWIHEDNLLPKMFEEDFLGDVIAYGKRKNITVKPLFNSLGHNTLIPKMIPEISAKKENGESTGFGFCTKNEKTYEVMFDIYDEIIERYLAPNGIADIEIGLDEVGSEYICHCEACRSFTHAELMVEYIIRLCKHLKSKGMKRIYIYHDMLYHEFDVVNEDLKQRFIREGIYDEVVLDWWTYEDPQHLFWDKPEGVNNLFHSVIKPDTGYYNWVIPTENNENIRACAGMAKKLGFEGIETYGSFDPCYDKNYMTLADVCWNSDTIEKEEEFNLRYAYRNYPEQLTAAGEALQAMSDVMKDEAHECYMNKACYKLEYYFYCYSRPGLPYPQHFPETVFQMIHESKGLYPEYLRFLKEKAKIAVDFFENNHEHHNRNSTWLLTAKHYYELADEYLTLYSLDSAYKEGLVGEQELLEEIKRLLTQREALMLLAENVRLPFNAYLYLRHMSIFRQLLCDLKNYLTQEIAAKRKPVYDIYDMKHILTAEFDFLR